MDDYFTWLTNPQCCFYNEVTGDVCQSNFPDYNELPWYPGLNVPGRAGRRQGRAIGPETDCEKCDEMEGNLSRPTQDQFRKHLKWYLEDSPGDICPPAGKGAYQV